MDPQTLPTAQTTVPQPINQTSSSESLLKKLINLRINRRTFLIGVIFYQVIYYISLNFFISWKDPLVDKIYFPLFYLIFHTILMLFYIWRLHDINRSGFWTLTILIPRIIAHIPDLYSLLLIPRMIVDLLFTMFLFFKKGSETANDYSEKPKIFCNLV